MSLTTLSLTLLAIAFAAYYGGHARAEAAAGDPRDMHSRPRYHGYFVAIRSVAPALLVVLGWLALEPVAMTAVIADEQPRAWQSLSAGERRFRMAAARELAAADGDLDGAADADVVAVATSMRAFESQSRLLLACAALGLALLSGAHAFGQVHADLRARTRVEAALTAVLVAASGIALLTTVGIVLSVLFEALQFFRTVPVGEFLFGTEWSPQVAIRDDQVGSSGRFGALPLFAGTLLIAVIAMLVAVPLGLLAAIYFSEYASPALRRVAQPLLEVLAGIPTVVYGFFAVLTVAPALAGAGEALGIPVAAESALAAGLVMGIMIIPLISTLADDAINAVPLATREAAVALGATRSEAMLGVVMPAAMPGIVGGILLAMSRAIGETMIVVMAAGLAANLTANPFAAVTTVTVQIVSLLVGDQEFASAKTLAAFALGLTLFLATLTLNAFGLAIVKRYRARYEA